MAFRIEKKWRWLVALGALFVPGIVSGALSLPFTFSAGQPIRASEVNANFEALRAKLDGLSGPPVRPTVGTLTLAGIASQLPIRKFSESINVAVTAGSGASAKPTVSDIQVIWDVGASDPMVNSTISQGTLLASADITLGSNLSLHLTNVHLDQLTIGPAQAGVAQETLSLSFETVQWKWQVGTAAATLVSFDVGGTGSGSGVKSFKYAYFAPGVTPDTTYLPISGYTHIITCPPSAKCTQGALSVQKTIGSETLDELALVTSGSTGLSAQLSWFTAAGTASNQIQLANAIVSAVSVTSNDDGTFAESVDFNYAQITWKAGATQATFDATAAQSI